MIEVDVKIAIVAGKTAGRAEGAPAGRLVSGSFIPLRIDEALGHQPGVPVGGEPVVGQAPGSTGEQGAGEIRIEGAFGPDQKTTILRDQAKPGGALALGPAQPATPQPQAQRRTRPAEQGEPPPVGTDRHVAERLAHEVGVVQSVLRAQRLIKLGTFVGQDQAQFEGGQPGQSQCGIGVDHAPSATLPNLIREKKRLSSSASDIPCDR